MSKEFGDLIEQARKHQQKGQLARAIELAEKATKVAAKEFGEADKETFYARNFHANLLIIAGLNDRAMSVIEEYISTDTRLFGPESFEAGMDYRLLGMVLKNMDRGRDAKGQFKKAVFIMEKDQSEFERQLGDCYFLLGDIATEERKLKDMNKWFEKAATIFKNHLDTRGNWYMLANVQMIKHAHNTGELQRAREIGRTALADLDRCKGLDESAPEGLYSLVAETEYRLGNLESAVSSYQDAYKAGLKVKKNAVTSMEWLFRAVEVKRMAGGRHGTDVLVHYAMEEMKRFGRVDPRKAFNLEAALAWCHYDSGDIENAIASLKGVLEKAERRWGVKQTDIGLLKIELGRFVHLSGGLDEGERLLEEGRDTFDKGQHYGADEELIPYYQYQFDILLERGLGGEAQWLLRDYRLAVMMNFIYADRTPERAQYALRDARLTRNWSGLDATSSGLLEVMSRRALEEAQNSYSEWHPALTPFVIELAEVLTLSGEWEASISLLGNMYDRLIAAFPKGNSSVIDLLMEIARVEEGRGNHQQSWQALVRAYEMANQRWGDRHNKIAEIYLHLSRMYLNAGDVDKAEQASQSALSSVRIIAGTKNAIVADILGVKARIKELRGDMSSAGNFLRNSLEIYREIYGEGHRKVVEAEDRIGHPSRPQTQTEGPQGSIDGPRESPPIHAMTIGEWFQQAAPRHIRLRRMTIASDPIEEFVSVFPERRVVSLVQEGNVDKAIYLLNKTLDEIMDERSTKSKWNDRDDTATYAINEKMAQNAMGLGLLYLSKDDRWSAGKLFGRAFHLLQEVYDRRHPKVLRAYSWLASATDGWSDDCDETTRFIREHARTGYLNLDDRHFNTISGKGVECKKKGLLREAGQHLRAAAELAETLEEETTSNIIQRWADYCDVLISIGELETADGILEGLINRWKLKSPNLSGLPMKCAIYKAKINRQLNRHRPQIEFLGTVLNSGDRNYGEDLLEMRLLLVESYHATGEYSKSSVILEDAKKQLGKKRCKGPEGDRLALLYLSLSKQLDDMGGSPKA